MAKLSKAVIDRIEPPIPYPDGKPRQEFHRDDTLRGFALRVTSNGAKTYIVETRINGRSRRISLGPHGRITCEQARKQAMKVLGDIALGGDPAADKKTARARSVTLRQVYRDYLLTRKNLKPNTLHDYERCIEGALADWLDKPIAEISKDMIELRHRNLGERSAARANNTMRVLRALFNFAREQYEDAEGNAVLVANPVERLSKNRAWYRVERRQTVLKPHQLKTWYDAVMQLNRETTRDYLLLLLLTGLRRSEGSQLRWEHIDLKDRSLIISDTKNRQPHTLPLSDYLYTLLKRRSEESESAWVFPSSMKDGPLTEPRTALERIETLSGIRFTLHDLRRTFITTAESLDISAYAVKRLVNHTASHDVTAGYIITSVERLRAPMQRITDYLLTHATGPIADQPHE